MVLWEIASRKLPYTEFTEYLTVTKETLSNDMLNSEEILYQLRSNGFEIKGDVAIKEQYKIQAIKEAIIEEDLRPTLPSDLPSFFKIAIIKSWVKNPSSRPSLVHLDELFSQKLKEDEIICQSQRGEEESDESSSDEAQYLLRLNNKRFFELGQPEEHPLRLTFTAITLKDIVLKGNWVQIRLKFRGKHFYSSKLRVPSKKKISKLEFTNRAVSKLVLDTQSTSTVQIHVMSGSFKMHRLCRTECFVGYFLEDPQIQSLSPPQTLHLVNKDNSRNGSLEITALHQFLLPQENIAAV